MTRYKTLRRDGDKLVSCHGGTQEWTPGVRVSVEGELIPCKNGVHICRDEVDLLSWLDEVICPVTQASSEHIDAENKRVVRWAVIGEPNPYWNERTARHFAVDCARRVADLISDEERGLYDAVLDICDACAEYGEEWEAARASASVWESAAR